MFHVLHYKDDYNIADQPKFSLKGEEYLNQRLAKHCPSVLVNDAFLERSPSPLRIVWLVCATAAMPLGSDRDHIWPFREICHP